MDVWPSLPSRRKARNMVLITFSSWSNHLGNSCGSFHQELNVVQLMVHQLQSHSWLKKAMEKYYGGIIFAATTYVIPCTKHAGPMFHVNEQNWIVASIPNGKHVDNLYIEFIVIWPRDYFCQAEIKQFGSILIDFQKKYCTMYDMFCHGRFSQC
jgi:hypothetical protein